jgi:hypothetical protein
MFLACEVKHCSFIWWCVALPPKATLHHLEHVVGLDASRQLLKKCSLAYSVRRSEDMLWPAPLEGEWPTVFLNVEVSRHERHLHIQSNKVLDTAKITV